MRFRPAALAALVLSLAIVGCDADDSALGQGGAGPGATERQPGPFEAMLAFMPADPTFLGYPPGVDMGDIARFRELSGEAPWEPAGESELEYLVRLTEAGQRSDVPFPGLWFVGTPYEFATTENTRMSMGFGVGDVEQWARPIAPPPRDVGVIRGAFDPEEAARLLAACDECPQAEVATHLGTTYWRWGGDFEISLENRLTPPAYDRLGRGGRIAVLEHAVVYAIWDAGIEAVLAAQAGVGSLADDERLRLAAEHLDRRATVSAFLTDWTQSTERAEEFVGMWRDVPELRAVAEAWVPEPGEAILEPYTAMGWGRGHDDDGPYTLVVLVHETAELAQANVPLTERRLAHFEVGSDGVFARAPESVEVAVDGVVVLITMRPIGLQADSLALPYFLHRP
jgi:hypothetical protein